MYRVLVNVKKIDDYWYYFYIQTYCRLPPYIIGILLGWLLHKSNAKDLVISQRVRMKRIKNIIILMLMIFDNSYNSFFWSWDGRFQF